MMQDGTNKEAAYKVPLKVEALANAIRLLRNKMFKDI